MVPRSRRSQGLRLLVTLAVLVAMAVPVVRDRDSFPLSTHPMYATARDRSELLVAGVGLRADDTLRRLSLDLAADTDDPLVAESTVEQAIRSGDAPVLCTEIAGRISNSDRYADVVAVAIVTEQVDLVDFIESGVVEDRTIHARCEVRR